MVLCGSVASLALHTGDQRIESKFLMINGVRCMAAETLNFIIGRHELAGGLHQICWLGILSAQREIQSVQRPVVANPALIEFALVFIDVGLSGRTKTESPANRDRDCLRAIRNG